MIEDAISIGLENNYSIKLSRKQAAIDRNNLTRGNAGFLPVVTLSASQTFTRENVKQEFLGGQENERDGAKSDRLSAGASLRWTFFDGMKMFITYDKLRELNQAGNIDVERIIENSIRDIILAYYRITLEKNKVGILDTSIKVSEVRLNIANSKYDLGRASKLEYMSAQVDYNEDRSALIRQNEAFTNAKIELNRLLSRDVEEDFTVVETIDIDTTLQLNQLLEQASSDNKDIMMARKNLSISDLEMREIDAEKWPTLDFNIGFNYSNLSAESGFLLSNRTDGFTYGVSANWPIFNGFNVHRRYQNARINTEISQLMIEDLELQVVSDIKKTFITYQNNITLLQLERENFQVAMENADIALERYKVGMSDALELREAQINAVEALGRLVDATYTTKIAEVDLLLLSGQLLQKE